MALKTVNGLTYEIVTPSHWQLAGYPVEVSFLGDAWFLSLLAVMDDGNTEVKMTKLASRDAGLCMIEQAFQRNNAAQ